MNIDFIILAAGKGKRMAGHVPKVLKILGGKPMAQHVMDTTKLFKRSKALVVVGNQSKEVKNSLVLGSNGSWVKQMKQLGTGHAVKQCLSSLRKNSISVVLYGDVPLVEQKTLDKLIKSAIKDDLAILTMNIDNPKGYGRIIRDSKNKIIGIREEKDATNEEREIKEVNTGIIAIRSNLLKELIPKIKNKNASKEFYLTDIVEVAKKDGKSVKAINPLSQDETLGANSVEELHHLERIYQKKEALKLISKGVRFGDINRFDIRGTLKASPGCFVDVNCIFEGEVELARNTNIGPNCYIKNSKIGENTKILPNTVIEDSVIGKNCSLGPFLRARGNSIIQQEVDLGNFVEINRSKLQDGVKAKHLTYLGDAQVGPRANIGAGTITCNYDGRKKFTTVIEEEAFIGSNSSLVAPVKIGKKAYTGAGSVITKNVPSGKLAIGRGRQKNIDKKKT